MKKTCLLFLPLAFLALPLHAQITYETFRAELEKNYQKSRSEVHMRDSMPVLYIDTSHCIGYTFFPNYHLDNATLEGWTYDTDNKELEARRKIIFLTTGLEVVTKRNSLYDAQGRLNKQVTSSIDNAGQITPSLQVLYDYNGLGQLNSLTRNNWDGTSWYPDNRELYLYDAEDHITELVKQSHNGTDWVNSEKTTHEYDIVGNLLQTETSNWISNAWEPVFQYNAVYDANSNLEEEVFLFGFSGNPLTPNSKTEYFNLNGKVDSAYSYAWNQVVQDWNLTAREVRVYNMSNELVELYSYTFNGMQFVLNNRTLLYTDDNLFGFPDNDFVFQNWNANSSTFLDNSQAIYDFEVLPGNMAAGSFRFSSQDPPGSGEWLINNSCDYGYHYAYVTGTQQVADAKTPCSMPNPYTTGQWIQCDQLHDNFTYMAQVFSADGRRVYARAFKGSEGWSIERQLPEGLYVVVLTHNDRPVWKNKVVVRQ